MKHFFLFLTLILLNFAAHSQDFRFGVKGGANYADINGKELDKNAHRYKLGWHAGAMVNIQYPGNTYFSIQPEIIYSRKGYENYSLPFEIKDNQGNLLYSAQNGGLVRLNYIDIPVMFNFKSGIIIFEIGPQISFLTGVRNDAVIHQTFADGTIITSNNDSRRYTNDGVKKIDLGFATGFRLETQNGVGLGLRFNQGFIKLPTSDQDAPSAPDGFNQVFQLFASYLIPEL